MIFKQGLFFLKSGFAPLEPVAKNNAPPLLYPKALFCNSSISGCQFSGHNSCMSYHCSSFNFIHTNVNSQSIVHVRQSSVMCSSFLFELSFSIWADQTAPSTVSLTFSCTSSFFFGSILCFINQNFLILLKPTSHLKFHIAELWLFFPYF